MTSEKGFVNEPEATVASWYFGDGSVEGELRETVKTEFHQWPYGNRGMYTVDLDLDAAGKWSLDITIGDPSQGAQTAELFFEVLDTPEAPPVGAPAPRSVSKTEADVASLKELATGGLQDADLYQTTIADAVQNGLPTVVVFASPAFCTNAVCGPQVEVLQQLKDKYKGQANFVHVDFYENPDEIPGRPEPGGDLDGGARVGAAEHRVDFRDRPAGRHIRQVRGVRHPERGRAGVPAGAVGHPTAGTPRPRHDGAADTRRSRRSPVSEDPLGGPAGAATASGRNFRKVLDIT